MIIDVRHPDEPIAYVNRAVALAYGYSDPQAMIGQSARSLAGDTFTAEDRTSLIRDVVETGSARMDVSVHRWDGSHFTAGYTVTPLEERCWRSLPHSSVPPVPPLLKYT